MAMATFDTLKFANTLKAAGVPPAQAEAQAFAEVMQLNLKELVTRDDLKQELKDVEQRLTGKLDTGLADLKVQIGQIKGELVLVRWMLGVGVSGIAAILIRMFFVREPLP